MPLFDQALVIAHEKRGVGVTSSLFSAGAIQATTKSREMLRAMEGWRFLFGTKVRLV